MERKDKPTIGEQLKRRSIQQPEKKPDLEGNFAMGVISTGSTLLDLAISGGRVRGGGLPNGIFVEVFGPTGSGKTVLLCEIAGAVQRQGGQIMFHDPEARLNKLFATLFDLHIKEGDYSRPERVPEVFSAVRKWKPVPDYTSTNKVIHGIFADSLAALSTQLEMENEKGDLMGTRRAKEFSEELRKTCRILAERNYLMVCSNQLRENITDAGSFAPRFSSPGGEAIKFYSSLRIQAKRTEKLIHEVIVAKKTVKRVVGVTSEFEVCKSTVWKPYHFAPVTILFDYGIDDIRENLQFYKTFTGSTVYCLGDLKLSKEMEVAIDIIEEEKLEKKLREKVIDLWEEIEKNFDSDRKKKIR